MNKRPAINFFPSKWFTDCPAYEYGTNSAGLFHFFLCKRSTLHPMNWKQWTVSWCHAFFMVDAKKCEERCTRRLVFCSKINELDRHGVEFFVLYCFCFDGGYNFFLSVKRSWTLSKIPSKRWDTIALLWYIQERFPLWTYQIHQKIGECFHQLLKVYILCIIYLRQFARAERHSLIMGANSDEFNGLMAYFFRATLFSRSTDKRMGIDIWSISRKMEWFW